MPMQIYSMVRTNVKPEKTVFTGVEHFYDVDL